jgi:hypothetical protein
VSKLASLIREYGPGTKYNMPVPEIEKWYRLHREEANRASQVAKLKSKYGIV